MRLAVISWLAWIKRQQAKFAAQERRSPRDYVSGESHYYLGDRYLLNVTYHDGPPQVSIRNKTTIDLIVRTGSDTAPHAERVLLEWQRNELKALIPPLLAKWEPMIGVQVAEWGVDQNEDPMGDLQPRRAASG